MTALPEWLSHWSPVAKPSKPIRVVGIDLGTTNSTVSEIVWSPDDSEPPVVTLMEIAQPIPGGGEYIDALVSSVVAILGDKEYVGRGAQRSRGGAVEPFKSVWFDTKNDIGTSKTYPNAPEGFKTPTDIAGKVLSFLKHAIDDFDDRPVDRIVVTVPASFQLTQRQATLDAAQQAGIDLAPGNLLDEPVAALLDFLNSGQLKPGDLGQNSRTMVVDFGGGTCDIALLQLRASSGGGVEVARRGVSRFTRLGGSDISRKIAHDVLFPKLLDANGLTSKDFNFRQKDRVLEALSLTADQLKQALSEKANAMRQAGAGIKEIEQLSVQLPADVQVTSPDPALGPLVLPAPSLTYAQLDDSLTAFLNPHAFEPEYSEYWLATSIFAPIKDVLTRIEWTPDHIDRILLVGGSGLLLPVQRALQDYFANAQIDTFLDGADAQRCVGRGAAWHAFFLEAFGSSPVAPTLGESLSVATNVGNQIVIEENSPLPFPAAVSKEEFFVFNGLKMPEDASTPSTPLSITLRVGKSEVQSQVIAVTPPAKKDDPIHLRLRFDENQVLSGSVVISSSGEEQTFPFQVDNPLSVSINPNAKRERILQLEQQMSNASPAKQLKIVEAMARLRAELGEYDRAAYYYQNLAQNAPTPKEKAAHYERLADIIDKTGDDAATADYYRKAIELGSPQARFNFALWLMGESRFDEGLEIIEAAIASGESRVRHLLHSSLLSKTLRETEAKAAYTSGLETMVPIGALTDWELGWLQSSARGFSDKATVNACAEERKKRSSSSEATISRALLPDFGE